MYPRCEDDFAVITGASRGLGAAFAEACAERGWNLVLAALPGEGLREFSEQLMTRWGIRVHAVELDLSRPESQQGLTDLALSEGKRVRLLVNNAGIGPNGLFDRIPGEVQRRTVDVNIQATLAITRNLVDRMAEFGSSAVLTVASLSAYCPMPLFAVYASTKAFLLNWSLALRHELAPLGISVTAVAPGGILTSPEIRAKVRAQGLGGRLSTLEPAEVADAALRGAARGKAVVVPGVFNRFLRGLSGLIPRDFAARLVHARWKKSLQGLASADDAPWYFRRDEVA